MSRWIPVALALVLVAGPLPGCGAKKTGSPTGPGTPAASAPVNEALDLVPADALGFILIKNLDELSGKIDGLLVKLKVKDKVNTTLIDALKKGTGLHKGLNEKGSAVLVVLKGDSDKERTRAVFALPVSDYPQVAQQLGVKDANEKIADGVISSDEGGLWSAFGFPAAESKQQKGAGAKPLKHKCLVARKGNFVLLAPPTARAALEKAMSTKESLRPALSTVTGWLGEQDISAVCTDKGVHVLAGAHPFLAAGPGNKGEEKTLQAEVEKNVRCVAVGGRIEKEGHPRLLARVYYKPDSPFVKRLAELKPLDGNLLDRFPAEPYFAAGSMEMSLKGMLSPDILGGYPGVRDLLPSDIPVEDRDKFAKEMDHLLGQVGQVGLVVYKEKYDPKNPAAVEIPGKAGGTSARTVLMATVKDAPAFVEDAGHLLEVTKLLEGVQKSLDKSGKAGTKMNRKKLQVNGKPALLVSLTTPVEPFKPAGEGADKGKDKGDKANTRTFHLLLTVADDRTILAGEIPDEKSAETWAAKILQHKGSGLGADARVKQAAALLPSKLQAALYVNVSDIGRALRGTGEAPEAPPPAACALRGFDSGIEFQIVVPFETLQGLAERFR